MNKRGDTIVEVLIALTVLAFALGTSFAIVSASNKAVQANKEQYQAQQLANKQIELLRVTDGGYNKTASNQRTKFDKHCILDSGAVEPATGCSGIDMGGADIYTVAIQCPDGTGAFAPTNCKTGKGDFTVYNIQVTWDNVKGGQSQVVMEYGL